MAAKSRSQVNQGAGKQIGDNQLAAKIVRNFFGSANHQSIIYKILCRVLAARRSGAMVDIHTKRFGSPKFERGDS